MTVVNDFESDTFHTIEYVRAAGERYTLNLTDTDGKPIQGFMPTNLCVTKGVIEATNPDGSVWIRRAPIVSRNWLNDGEGGIGMHILEDMHGYCAIPKTDEVAWVCHLETVEAGAEFTMSAFDHPQRLFLCKGAMAEPSGASRSPLYIWTVKPNDTPKFVARTDCLLMRLVGLPSADDVQSFLTEHPDSTPGGGI